MIHDIGSIMRMSPVIPVITIEDVRHAAPLARALVSGGLRVLEVTLRTRAALECIRAMRDVEGAVVGAGTVTNPDQLDMAINAGSSFVVSPGLTPALGAAMQSSGVAVLPGVATASELMAGLALGLTHFKLFPAEQAGGVAMLKALSGPFPEPRFCPTGGVTPESAGAYLALPNVLCVGGSWIATPKLVAEEQWGEIEARAATASRLSSLSPN